MQVRCLPCSLLVLFSIVIFMVIRFPIYPDEVSYRILLERFFISGGFKVSLLPYCTEGFQVVPNNLLKLSAFFWSLLTNLNSAISYRVIPVILLVASLGISYAFALSEKKVKHPCFLLIFILGVPIYGLIIIRPEIFIVFFMVVLTISGLYVISNSNRSNNFHLFIGFVVVGFYILLCYVHPKALYFVLPITVFLGLVAKKVFRSQLRFFFVLLMMFFVYLTTYDAIKLHTLGFLSCNAFPDVANAMSNQGVNLLDIFKKPHQVVHDFFSFNDINNSLKVLWKVLFKRHYDLNIFPKMQLNLFIVIADLLILFLLLVTLLHIISFIMIGTLHSVKSRNIRKDFLFYLTVVAVVMAFLVLNKVRAWYDVSLFIFSLGFLSFVASNLGECNFSASYLDKLMSKISPVFIVAILMSLVINYSYIYIELSNGYVGPGLSVETNFKKFNQFMKSKFYDDYSDVKTPIIIDDLTYHSFYKHQTVYPITYILLHATRTPEIINSVTGSKINAITQCSYLDTISTLRKIKVLRKENFINGGSLVYSICKWQLG